MSDFIQNKTGRLYTLPQRQSARLEWVDVARGLAILLVVYRHSLVGLNRSGFQVPQFLYNIQEYVYNFRMPVFFALSGIFLSRAVLKHPMASLLRKKVNTLLYPYLLWTVILITIQIIFSKYTNTERSAVDYLYIVTQPRNLDHMWYLLALFNTSVLFILLHRLLKHRLVLHFIIALGMFLVAYFIRDYSVFSDLFYHYIFLLAGYATADLVLNSPVTTKKWISTLLLLTPLFVAGQWAVLNLIPDTFVFQPLFLFIILVAAVFFYLFSRLLFLTGLFNWLIPVGKNSLPIYILHLFVISSVRIGMIKVLGVQDIYLIIITSLILGILLPIFVYRAGRKWGMLYLFSLEPLSKQPHG